VYSNSNFALNKAFYSNVFDKKNGVPLTLGEMYMATKNESIDGVRNRNFALIGDPSMTLAFPKNEISYTLAHSAQDTLRPLQLVKLNGQINHSDASILSNFHGLLTATVYDKEQERLTFGDENPPATFQTRENVLFRGNAEVKDGKFEMEFLLPVTIDKQYALGKISLYASGTESDASGAARQLVVGGQSEGESADTTPPMIHLYINDTTFVSGGKVEGRPVLLARLQDESGINISAHENNPGIRARLTSTGETFQLNAFYTADAGNFKQGWVRFPLDLEPGEHSLSLLAADNYNNPMEWSIDFTLIEGSMLSIADFAGSPNPFEWESRLSFYVNRENEDLDVLVELYSLGGERIKTFHAIVERNEQYVQPMTWDGANESGAYVESGLYVAKLRVTSLKDGAYNFATTKLIYIR
jgi:hypothetical protein